jgi:hypothetical protein
VQTNSSSTKLYTVNATYKVVQILYSKYTSGGYGTVNISAYNGGGAVGNSSTLRFYERSITLRSPSGGQVGVSPTNLVCDVNWTMPAGLTSLELETNLYNATTNVSTQVQTFAPAYNLQMTTTPITLPVGSYNWSCTLREFASAPYLGATYVSNDNNSFSIINTFTTNPTDTRGECTTTKGRGLTYTAASNTDYVLLNLTSVRDYLVNRSNDNGGNMTNVWIEGLTNTPPVYKRSNYHLLVDTRTVKVFTIWLAPWTNNYTYMTSATSPTVTVNGLTAANFTTHNNEYWVTLKNESGVLFDSSTTLSNTLSLLCLNYAPDSIDFKTLGYNPIYIATKERPKFSLLTTYQNSTIRRVYQTVQDSENLTIYALGNNTQIDLVNVQLNDYVGYFGDAYVQVYQNINASLRAIWQEQVNALVVNNITITNNTYVQYVVYTPAETRVIGWDLVTIPTTKIISLTRPTFAQPPKSIGEDIRVGYTNSYPAGTVGVVYNSTYGDLNTFNFTVYIQNNTGMYMVYSSQVSGIQSGTIDHIVANKNLTYMLSVVATTTNGSVLRDTTILNLQMLNSNWSLHYDNLGIPQAGLFGASKDRIYTGLAMIGITAAAMMFSPASVGWGGIYVVAVIGLTKYYGWFREMTWSIWGILAVMALAYMWVENRRKLE